MSEKEEKNIPVGIIFGKTSPSIVQAVSLHDAPKIGIGRLLKIAIRDDKGKLAYILGRVATVWTQNRLLSDENMMPKLTSKDLKEGTMTIEHLGLASQIAGQIGFSIIIIGMKAKDSFIRPRVPLDPGTVVYLADDAFVSSFFKKEQTINIGQLRDNRNVPAYIDYEKLVTHHFSVLAMTGAGKSYTVGVILEELYLIEDLRLPIILVDPHGEYSSTSIPAEESEEAKNIARSVITFVPGNLNIIIEKRFEKH
ncbi:MAG: ATP-binding protein, partial [Candidatus Heimdallarchaeaceae archaeon]